MPMLRPEFVILAKDLDAAGKSLSFDVRAAWIRGALEEHEATAVDKDGSLKVRASKSGTDVVIHGRLHADLQAPCARCLKLFPFSVDTEVTALMVPATKMKSAEEELELSASEAEMIPYDGETIVLDDFVRDELILETPMIPLCSEDCPGLPDAEKAAKSAAFEPESPGVDPRLAPLLKLQGKLKN